MIDSEIFTYFGVPSETLKFYILLGRAKERLWSGGVPSGALSDTGVTLKTFCVRSQQKKAILAKKQTVNIGHL